MSDSDSEDAELGDSALAILMETPEDSDEEDEEEQEEAAPLLAIHLPPPRHILGDPLRDVIESNLVFNSLVRMIYSNENFDPTDYFDFDDYPRTPISREWLDQLPPPAGLVQEMCTICLGEADEDSVQLPCNHVFHRSCLERWFQRRNTCPVCRVECACSSPTTTSSYYEVSTNQWRRHIRHMTITDIENEIEEQESSEPEGAVASILAVVQQQDSGVHIAEEIFAIDDDLSEQELREEELREVVSDTDYGEHHESR